MCSNHESFLFKRKKKKKKSEAVCETVTAFNLLVGQLWLRW